MGDLLVKLYDLPAMPKASDARFQIKRPMAPEKRTVVRWVEERFGERWASEVEMAFSGHPIRCFVALGEGRELAGFACYDTSFRGFFGPTGVDEEYRGRGIGTALLLRSLHAMADEGYAYAVIGYSGADEYYQKTVGAIPIPDSEPGPYRDWIKRSG
ncbi:MAG: GNAT family N-acetyltransferase [Verrucomicrobiales bacterium]|nr:GNAT family N-acetyltransferase [Verrucomicrobiales bacterium]